MRFFISVNKKEIFMPNRYYREGLDFETEIPLGNMFTNGRVRGTESYKLIAQCAPLMQSPVAKNIQELVSKSSDNKHLFFIESNSAHNITYFTSNISTASLEEGKKLLIVNFDQHSDHGTATGELLCSNWGGFAGNDLQCDYLVIGEPSYYPDDNCSFYQADRKRIQKSIKGIETEFQNYDAIYVTVDMDVLQNGIGMPKRTNWGEGKLTKEALISHLKLLPDGKITSADITGFPPFEMSKLAENEKQFTQYITDISEIAQVLENKF